MTALAACLRKAGKAINKPDADAIAEIAEEYRAGGMRAQEAADTAVTDYLDVLSAERADILTRSQEAGADITSDALTGAPGISIAGRERAEQTGRETADRASQEERERVQAESDRPQVRWSLKDDEVDQIDSDPTHPASQRAKLMGTVEEAISAGGGTVEAGKLASIIRGAKKAWNNNKGAVLRAVPLRALGDFVGETVTGTREYVRLVNRMSGAENQMQQEMLEVLEPWKQIARRDKTVTRRLAGVMHQSTIAGVNPAKDFVPRFNESMRAQLTKLKSDLRQGKAKNPLKTRRSIANLEEAALLDARRKTAHPVLKEAYNSLPQEAKDVYNRVLELNEENYARLQQALENRINQISDTDLDATSKSSLIAKMRREFEAGRVDPYFPLSRFGKHWSSAKDSEGNVISFAKFEDTADQALWRKEWEAAGATVTNGTDSENFEGTVSQVDPAFATQVADLAKGIGGAQGQALASEIWQAYLKRLPEMSARKAFIHRKGISGFTGDAMRAFADNAFHTARQIAKAEYGYQLEQAVALTKTQTAELRDKEGDLWASAVSDELAERHQWVMNPRVNAVAAKLTSGGFHWFLGLNPSSAAVNLTQSWLVGLPILASYNPGGTVASAGALMKASKQMIGNRAQRLKRLTDEERQAYEEFERIGLFDQTRSAELLGVAEGGVDVTSRLYEAGQISAKMFHLAEQFNREVTSLAAYRMARKRGLNHTDAVLEAEDVTWDSHFDYSNKNRPRVLQNDFLRVALLFRNYGANMSYRVIRDLRDSLKADIPAADRKAALTRAIGVWMMTLLNAGASGLPLVWLATYAIDELFGDEDEPIDPKVAMRMHLADQFGQERANWIMDGVTEDLTGVSISNRVSLSNLWFMDAPYETKIGSSEWLVHYGAQAFGPIASAISDAAYGAGRVGEGDTWRGLEKMVPNEMRNVMKAMRYFDEGVRTMGDQEVVPQDEVSAYDSFVQAFGFTPRKISLAYETARAKTGIQERLQDRKQKLKRRYFNTEQGTPEREAALEEIRTFDSKNPDFPIGPTLGRATRAKARAGREYQGGVRVRRGLRRRLRELDFTDESEDE